MLKKYLLATIADREMTTKQFYTKEEAQDALFREFVFTVLEQDPENALSDWMPMGSSFTEEERKAACVEAFKKYVTASEDGIECDSDWGISKDPSSAWCNLGCDRDWYIIELEPKDLIDSVLWCKEDITGAAKSQGICDIPNWIIEKWVRENRNFTDAQVELGNECLSDQDWADYTIEACKQADKRIVLYQDPLNDWMQLIAIVDRADQSKTVEIINRAIADWYDCDPTYGYAEECGIALREAGICADVVSGQEEEDNPNLLTREWDEVVEKITASGLVVAIPA